VYGILRGSFAIAIFGFMAFWNIVRERVLLQQRTMIRGLCVRDAMQTCFFTVPHSAVLRDVQMLTALATQPVVPVVYGQSVLGVLDHGSVRSAAETHGLDAYVAVATDRNVVRVAPDDVLESIMGALNSHAGCALVMDGDELRGLLTRESIAQAVAARVSQKRGGAEE
jgi:predicted transcriptional regulator